MNARNPLSALLRILRIAILAVAGAAPVFAASDDIQILQRKISSGDTNHYLGWPTVARKSDGKLLLVYSGGRDYHVCPFGRVEMMTSADDGATWTVGRVLEDGILDDRDSGIVETRAGTLLVSYFTSDAYRQHMEHPERLLNKVFGTQTSELLKRWKATDASVTDAQRKQELGFWMLRSTDGGMTWSSRYRVPGYAPHGPVNLDDGRLFYAAANGKKALALISKDDGLTWQTLAELPVRAGEMNAIQAADKSIIVQVRDKTVLPNGKVRQSTSQTLSTDGGKSWTVPVKVAEGYPSHLARLNDGRLVMTYGIRTPPYGIRGRVSRDHGRSWADEFVLTADAATWDLGYPSTAQLGDGSLLTVWYEVLRGSPRAVLRQARWKLPACPQRGC